MEKVWDSIILAFTRTIPGWISAVIHNTIIIAYKLLKQLSEYDFMQEEFLEKIYNKVGLILGLFMVFKLVFSLIQSLINPNKINDKKSGYAPVIMRSIISIALLGLTPTIFDEAMEMQQILVGNTNASTNIIYKLIISEPIDDYDQMGNKIASDLFFTFFRDKEDPKLDTMIDASDGYADADNPLDLIKNNIEKGRMGYSFLSAIDLLKEQDDEGNYIVEFEGLYSIAFGVIILWILIDYCIKISIRIFQLAYLELISPIPILSYISEPEGSFKKWVKQCTTTYLDLFIRLAIIYFVIYFSEVIVKSFKDALNMANIFEGKLFLKLFLITGLFLFAKRVPDLLKDLFPGMFGGGAASLGFGIKSPKKLWGDVKSTPVGWAAGKAGAVGRIGFNAVRSGIASSAAGTGFWKGAKRAIPKPKFVENMQKAIPQEVKDRRAANKEFDEYNKNFNMGQELYEKYGKTLGEKAFDNQEYYKSYESVQAHKQTLKEAKTNLENIENSIKVATAKGDGDAVQKLNIKRKAAEEAVTNAQSNVDSAQKRHDMMKKKYSRDALKENNHKLYMDANKAVKIPKKVTVTKRINSQNTSSNGSQPQSNNNTIGGQSNATINSTSNNVTPLNEQQSTKTLVTNKIPVKNTSSNGSQSQNNNNTISGQSGTTINPVSNKSIPSNNNQQKKVTITARTANQNSNGTNNTQNNGKI